MSYQILQPRVKNQTPANLMVLLRRTFLSLWGQESLHCTHLLPNTHNSAYTHHITT